MSAERAVFLVAIMPHSGAARLVSTSHWGSCCSFRVGEVLGKQLRWRIPRILQLGEFLGWEGCPHSGHFTRCPLQRLHRPQASTGDQSSPWEECWWPHVRKLWASRTHSYCMGRTVHAAGTLGKDAWLRGARRSWNPAHMPLVKPWTASAFR